MPLGGFAALDATPTLEQFKEIAQKGQLCYLVVQPEQLKVPGLNSELLAIQKWVSDNFTPQHIDGVTVYDLRR